MILMVDLRAQYRSIKGEIDEAVLRVLDSSQFVLGDEVAAFEAERPPTPPRLRGLVAWTRPLKNMPSVPGFLNVIAPRSIV